MTFASKELKSRRDGPMNLFVRLIKVLVLALLAPRVPVDRPLVTRLRVWPNDLDTNLHMNNGRYLTVMDLGRTDLIIRSGKLKVLMDRKWYPVVAATHITFRRSLNVFERFAITTQIIGWDDDWVYLEQSIHNSKGEMATKALFRTVFLHRGKRIASAELADAFGMNPISPPLPDDLEQRFAPHVTATAKAA